MRGRIWREKEKSWDGGIWTKYKRKRTSLCVEKKDRTRRVWAYSLRRRDEDHSKEERDGSTARKSQTARGIREKTKNQTGRRRENV